MSAPVVIVGAGLAGYNLAREWRKLDAETPLVIIARDAADYYSKPMLSNALASKKTPETLVMKPMAKMAEELRATLLAHTELVSIDTAARSLSLGNGDTLVYRDLVLALGADPVRLRLEGDAVDEVMSVNDLDDYARFAGRLDGVERVAILGAGLIGCEFANDLIARGIAPILIDPAAALLSRLLPRQAGEMLAARLTDAGVTFRCGAAAQKIERSGNAYAVVLDTGERIAADLVLSAVGLRPRTALAQAAGLEVARGIVLDRNLQSSAPHVYAMGDCAEVAGLNLPFVMPIMQQARALAATLAGTVTPVRYPAMPVLVKTPSCPTIVAPPLQGEGEWQIEPVEAGLIARYVGADGALIGFALLGTATKERQALVSQLPPWLA
ncbi:pyridine nucleotide-disulfide oxidoreductase [Jeongeupia sp. HS-3]|uniref:NAD(P)/FAD-dependent oxidoreductase n=1 Tax=Jeongeupia sp. HS-3 TaxID=1009682 RepID=UPI0018A6163C|nr:FAD-dependent oxidoreductase [Jeongeupia sp. HS-3]BCL75661.1 pyridine nucleotide-disulfide oxidoreductase [Jeongeupia sp. HS-3]